MRGRHLAGTAVGGGAILLFFAENWRPLRRPRQPKATRLVRNVAIALISAAVVAVCDRPVVVPVARLVERRGWGLLPRGRVLATVHTAAALVLLDYSLYVWHVLLHRVPLLWRCHQVHHVDLDLDMSTALRFHFSELILSVPWRVAQVVAIGVTPRMLSLWQAALFSSVLFHHSNLRLPASIERVIGRVVVTPRMHGIHHSANPREMGSNWSSGLSVWDRLHGTACLDVPQQAITIGVAGFQNARDVTLGRILLLPFRGQETSTASALHGAAR